MLDVAYNKDMGDRLISYLRLHTCCLYDLHDFYSILILKADLYLNKQQTCMRLELPFFHIVFCINCN